MTSYCVLFGTEKIAIFPLSAKLFNRLFAIIFILCRRLKYDCRAMATFARDKVRLQTEKYLGILQARELPPIHIGKEDGVERTLLRMACQGETIFSFTLAGRCHSTHFWGTVAAKVNLMS